MKRADWSAFGQIPAMLEGGESDQKIYDWLLTEVLPKLVDSICDSIDDCPYCGPEGSGPSLSDPYDTENFHVWCNVCHMQGPECNNQEDAVFAWNALPRRSE